MTLSIAGCGHAVAPVPVDCDRDVTIASQADVNAIESCVQLRGLVIKTAATVSMAKLAKLESIAGDLRVGPTVSVDELALPALRTIGGALHVSANGSLRGVFLPKLERARRVEIIGNVELATLSLPKLAQAEALVLSDDGELEIVDLTALGAVAGEVVVAGMPKLAMIEAPQLAHVGSARVDDAPKLPAELVDRLAAAQSSR